MAMIFPLTSFLYITGIVILIALLIACIFIPNDWQTVCLCIDFIILIAVKFLINYYAARKYNKTIPKMFSNLNDFIAEQNKFLSRRLVPKVVRNAISTNIACAYVMYERYPEALDIYNRIINDFKRPTESFYCFLNTADIYLSLGNEPMYFNFINLTHQVLNGVRNTNLKLYSKLLSEYEIYYSVLELRRTRSVQAAQMFMDIRQRHINLERSKKIHSKKQAINTALPIYILGLAYMVLGDTEQARSCFEQIAASTEPLPYVNRTREYLKTGNEEVLWH